MWSCRRSASTTFIPASTKAPAMPRPMPLAPPVTKATFPATFFIPASPRRPGARFRRSIARSGQDVCLSGGRSVQTAAGVLSAPSARVSQLRTALSGPECGLALQRAVKIVEQHSAALEAGVVVRAGERDTGQQLTQALDFRPPELAILEIEVMYDLGDQ